MTIPYTAFKHGQRFKATIDGTPVEGKVSIDKDGDVFLCQNKKDGADAHDKLGYKYSWCFLLKDENFIDGRKDVTSLTLLDRSILDVQAGDEVVDGDGYHRMILERLNDVVFTSRRWEAEDSKEIIEESKTTTVVPTHVKELERDGYTLVQPETTDDTVEVTLEEISKAMKIPVEKIRVKESMTKQFRELSLNELYSLYHKGRIDADCKNGECQWDEVVLEISRLLSLQRQQIREEVEELSPGNKRLKSYKDVGNGYMESRRLRLGTIKEADPDEVMKMSYDDGYSACLNDITNLDALKD